MTDDGKAASLAPVPKAAANLEGVLWTLALYVDSQGNLVGVLPGTRITAVFRDGRIGGNAGCNDYFASYRAAGERLTIGPIGATRRFCGEPDGVMRQESAYLEALESVTTYRIRGDRLEMRDADGVRVLTFEGWV